MTFLGGARIGMFNASWPFARLTLSEEMLLLKVLWVTYALKKEEVSRLEPFNGLFSSGVKIVHSTARLNPHAVFWSFDSGEVLTAARKLGFQTSNDEG